MPEFMCTVNGASIMSNGRVVLTLTDMPSPVTPGGQFPDSAVFVVDDAVKKEMLAIALTAISTQRQVWMEGDQPLFNSDHSQAGFAQCRILAVVVDYLTPPWSLG